MKKILFLIGGLLSSIAINAQVVNYSDAAIIFSDQDINGTARFNAMGGAFGSLGGDMSAAGINPAGLAVFTNSQAAFTLGFRDTGIKTDFYGTSINTSDNYFNLAQAGGALVFNAPRNSDWRKFAIGLNYSIAKDFEGNWLASGVAVDENNNVIAPLTDLYDPDAIYEFHDGQDFQNFIDGRNDKFVISFAAQHNENLYIGASVNTYNLDYNQITISEEFNRDIGDNNFDVRADQELRTVGNGLSLGVGAIFKPINELRLGIAFESPTWYNFSEKLTIYKHELFFNGVIGKYGDNDDAGTSVFDYDMKTPSRLTGSISYLFGKNGLISLDYNFRNYKNIKLKPKNKFAPENSYFSNDLKNTSELRIGGEWRVGKIVSLRGGYFYKQSPYADAIDSDHINGFSLGTGFRLGRSVKLDIAYQNSTNTDFYGFSNSVNPVEIDTDNSKVTATLVIGL